MSSSGPLTGRTAAVLRGPGRAGAIVAELASRGASALVCPLIDFELPPDTASLDESVRRLVDGRFDWMVLTSRTTVAALVQRCAALCVPLAVPAATRVAAVGDATRRAAEAAGMTVDLVPSADHSAEGILAAWPADAPGLVYLPQADIAAPTLESGLTARGWETDVVIAYRTVDAPADPSRRIAEGGPEATGPAVAANVTPRAFAELLADAGRPEPGTSRPSTSPAGTPVPGIDVVFLTSPSIVRRFRALAPRPPASLAIVAIGRSTAAEALRLGLPLSATATLPTPEGLCDAWEAALNAHPDLTPTPTPTLSQTAIHQKEQM